MIINWSCVSAILLRHTRMIGRDFSRLSWLLFWPMLDIVLWGYAGLWMQSQGSTTTNVAVSLMSAAVFWQVVGRASFDLAQGLVEEMWAHNMVNIFSSPLRLREWIVALVLLGLMMSTVLMIYCIGLVKLLYGVWLIQLGRFLPWFLCLLFLSGLWMGFLGLSVCIYYGPRMQSLVFMLNYLLAPFAGVFYSLEVLPTWVQYIGYMLPMTYLFQALRVYLIEGIWYTNYMYISLALSLIYMTIFAGIFYYAFFKSKEYGFARLVE